jgi:hypothetical protein
MKHTRVKMDVTLQILSRVAKPNKLGTNLDEVLHQRLHAAMSKSLERGNTRQMIKKDCQNNIMTGYRQETYIFQNRS